ncbi:MarR family winged helix-turn-helix transcriptional regulator [Gemmatimonas sp.]|jgi:DNA-binding MarR family transcriptional regulator|uniref:MarR family winged helix-turn-helix transcriptional regulator n=1 Tax=Gemmatimonas sp. TaxID=1962908 RepID=UPI0037C0299C
MIARSLPNEPPLRDIPVAMVGMTGFLVNTLGARLREVTEAHLSDARIRSRQIGLLLVLRDEGVLQQQILGERLAMDRTTTMRLVGELEALGLVSREECQDDRRAYDVRLTSRGTRVVTQVALDVQRAQAQVLAPLTDAEARTFHRLLLKLLGASANS